MADGLGRISALQQLFFEYLTGLSEPEICRYEDRVEELLTAPNFYNAVYVGPKVERTLEDFSISQHWIAYSALDRRVNKICTILCIPEGPRWQDLMP